MGQYLIPAAPIHPAAAFNLGSLVIIRFLTFIY
jgi:hypothetical protein